MLFVSINARYYSTSSSYKGNNIKLLKKGFALACSAHLNSFIETVKQEYLSLFAFKDNAACLQFAKILKLSPCN